MLEFQYIAEQILIKQCGETLPRKKRESDFSIRVTPSRAWKEHRLQAEREVASLGIGRSSDAGVLFDAFVKRFSFIEMPASQGSPPSIQSIAKTNGGNPRELAFVLAHLFNWNDIEADVVAIYPDNVAGRPKKFTSVSCEHALVHVPAIERYFDPTLRIAQQLKESGAKWVAEKPRIHYRGFGLVCEGYHGNAFYRMLKERRKQKSSRLA